MLFFSKPCCSSASHAVLQPYNLFILQQAMLFFSTLMLLSGMACTFMPVFSAFLSIWIGKNTVCC
jgi:hypothetical protein